MFDILLYANSTEPLKLIDQKAFDLVRNNEYAWCHELRGIRSPGEAMLRAFDTMLMAGVERPATLEDDRSIEYEDEESPEQFRQFAVELDWAIRNNASRFKAVLDIFVSQYRYCQSHSTPTAHEGACSQIDLTQCETAVAKREFDDILEENIRISDENRSMGITLRTRHERQQIPTEVPVPVYYKPWQCETKRMRLTLLVTFLDHEIKTNSKLRRKNLQLRANLDAAYHQGLFGSEQPAVLGQEPPWVPLPRS
ncbi:hypothetical protein NA57DRAFT_55373 [Rhizodiscina lignyota]|uniref:Uncharacterized protein n=1 Tax=Rhizodiscina lignyota TaxID=1504668 RepID=A0A9P4M6K8_9PEZI|nr:hypothetical protein NA57DRAFT_55373 [Rhizodiscina lignyota]